jgi:hypothetical protein
MATEAQVKAAILKVAGNPTSGVIKDLAEEFARAIVALDNPPVQRAKEVRVSRSEETR